MRVRVPAFQMPPPLLEVPAAILPEIMELEMERVPELLKAPPLIKEFAPETVTPEMLKSALRSMVKILKPPAVPLIVSEEAPGPVMVTVPAVPPVIAVLASMILGNAAARVMVAAPPENKEEAKLMVSLPAVLLARSMASRRVPPVAVSAKEVTGKLAGTILHSSCRSCGRE